ncbi:DUF5050 domain-containing protein [Paenibacillus sp. TSA_86.1]|uniref:DUF5050 domain-containing protein n=1 Tax=Paenibacillus sp. TSA_86.1 TaxID=3415649 RepID=UPI004046192B
MRRKWLIALLSVIMLFGIVPAYGAEDSGESLVWDGYEDNGALMGINVTTFTGNKSKTESILPKRVSDIQRVGEWIYFLIEEETESWARHMAKIKKDGSAFNYLNNEGNFGRFTVVRDTIYFVKDEGTEETPDALSFGSMRTDGSNEQTILSKSPFYNFKIYSGYIYFTNRDNGKFYRMNLDGTGKKLLSSKEVWPYEFYGNVLFFSENMGGRDNYSSIGVFSDKNGTRKKTFTTKGSITPLTYINNKFYYLNNSIGKNGYNQSDLYVFNRYTSKKSKLRSLDAYDRFVGTVGDGLAFLSFEKGTVYKLGYDGKIKK